MINLQRRMPTRSTWCR